MKMWIHGSQADAVQRLTGRVGREIPCFARNDKLQPMAFAGSVVRAAAMGMACVAAVFVASPGVTIAQNPSPTPRPSATPAPTPVPSVVRITSPVRDQLARGIVEIKGSAILPNFARYEVSYAPEARPNQWVLVTGETSPVNDGVLAVWNTAPISNTSYALRLQVFDRANAVREEFVRGVSISNTVVAATNLQPAAGNAAAAAPAASGGRTSGLPNINLADVPRGVTRGATWAAYGFLALGGYVLAKKLFWFVWRRVRPATADAGR